MFKGFCFLVAVLSQDLVVLGRLVLDRSSGLLLELQCLLLGGIKLGTTCLTLLLERVDNVAILPAHLRGQAADSAPLAIRAQANDTKSLGNDHLLRLVIGGRAALENLEALHGLGTTWSLVRDHAANNVSRHARRGAVVDVSARRVGGHGLATVGKHLELVTVKRARVVNALAPHEHNLLARQKLLGHNRGKAPHHVAVGIDDNLLLEHHGVRPFFQENKKK